MVDEFELSRCKYFVFFLFSHRGTLVAQPITQGELLLDYAPQGGGATRHAAD
jgi:hypothetical protein